MNATDAAPAAASSSGRPWRRLSDWLFNRRGREPAPVRLTQRRIFLLPTRYGLFFALVLLVMLGGSINYALSLGFVLTFLLASMAVVSMVHAFRNLVGLEVSITPAGRAFAGDIARFDATFVNPRRLPRYSVAIAHPAGSVQSTDCPGSGAGVCTLRIPAPSRGRLFPGRLTVFTRHPLGLFYAWSYVEPDRAAVVYPRPEAVAAPLPAGGAGEDGQRTGLADGQDDFEGLRRWKPGDAPQRIAWKAVARGQGLLTKRFVADAGARAWFDWNDTPASLGEEGRLSRLARWVIDADAAGMTFGLRLPGRVLAPASGEAQREAALEALALHGSHR
ncbi:MAG: DUF58 domain-containing protein [Rhodocyclaceae bacterium]|nr:DUF58 domain-containing protein [Rhodocyclaceae bacterium]MCE2980742.1 DUF58 domain-containing protein [Betaproteobacteria bacterium]MCA3074830.1 DUF58 domain-containing protein [Rhodocyclaceae bacterium]MCA3090843.1 DUF58 domain-containing protein [Rhodocyclaceae bacterium]MCA3095478.1 DUF58 domain-containing protein [Rhodocyclaceae bacterium]